VKLPKLGSSRIKEVAKVDAMPEEAVAAAAYSGD
jgi:hypothetical protein